MIRRRARTHHDFIRRKDEGLYWVLKNNATMGHDIFFDIDNQRIGWAERFCDYTKLVHDSVYNFDITGQLQDPQT